MAWTIAGVERRTRDAAEEAARRAGMRLDDWLDEAIADQAALGQRRAAGGRRERGRAARRGGGPPRTHRAAKSTPGREPGPPRVPDAFDSAIERFETRLPRAEAQAARAFESVAQILERSTEARDGDRLALIDAVRRLEAISANGAARLNPARERRRSRGSISRPQCRRSPCAASSSTVSAAERRRASLPAADEFDAPPTVRRTGPCSAAAGIAAATTFEPSRSSSTTCGASKAICTAPLSISAPCGPRSRR